MQIGGGKREEGSFGRAIGKGGKERGSIYRERETLEGLAKREEGK